MTTILLLLRAFYLRLANMRDGASIETRKNIGRCIWKTRRFDDNVDTSKLKIDSEVATDEDKDEFLDILRTGKVSDSQKSQYAKNYRFFLQKLQDLSDNWPGYFTYLPDRLLNNCFFLPIEAESQDTALRIFSTLNDRGKPLADTDIFKAQFYKYYKEKGEKKEFINRWKDLEVISNEYFTSLSGTPMDELFSRYMYFERAKAGIKSTTTEALRKFYERNKYAILKKDDTLGNLEALAKFWKNVTLQDDTIFSDRVLKKLSVLQYAPNGMWTYLTSVYFLQNRDANDTLNDEDFYKFLNKITAFIWGYSFVRPGVNALRVPAYPEMISIVGGNEVEFKDSKLDATEVRNAMENYSFTNNRPITKSMLVWWAYQNDKQNLIPTDTILETEHIYSRNRQKIERSLSDTRNMESLGNKAILERSVNIRASDYKFEDKKKYYKGFTTSTGKTKPETMVQELKDLADSKDDFTEQDIVDRKKKILDSFIQYLADEKLLK